MPEPQHSRNLERAERKFDVMQALGTDLVLVCGNTHAAAIDDDGRAAADLAEMAERARRRGLRVGYEALAWGRHVNRWRHAWNIVRVRPIMTRSASHSRQLSYACGEDDQSGITELPAERIFFVQLADAPRLAMDPLSWSRHTKNSPGQGQLPVADFLRAVFAAGYRGPLSLEVFSDEFRAASARHHEADGVTPADHVRYRDVAHRGDAEGGGHAALREEFGHQIAHGVIAR